MTQNRATNLIEPGLLHQAITDAILGNFFQVHRELGPGYVESIYATAMAVALTQAGFRVKREVPIAVYFRGVEVGFFRADMVVEEVVLLEFKAGRDPNPEFEARTLNYLHCTRLELGLLLYFNQRATFKRLIYTNDRKLLP